jgi:endonuclease/exonuclease/phosphatase family metal-dependent hydrolase
VTLAGSRQGAARGGDHRDPAVLRIATYNVRDFLDDRAAAARVVRGIAPDVLCLQEVPRRLTTELRLPAFARECGLYWSGGRMGSGGTAVLTTLRTRLHAAYARRLPVRFPDRYRGYAAVEVSLPGTAPLTVVSVHLSLREGERGVHAREIVRRLGPSAVVAGDLNEGREGGAYGELAGRYDDVSEGLPTFPADRPVRPLDVIFASSELDVVARGGPLGDPEDAAAASDHLPVWVDLRLGPAPGGGRPGGRR